MPSLAAITLTAPGDRFKAFEIFATPDLAFAIVFICRKSLFVHGRRTSFFALAIFSPVVLIAELALSPHNLSATERGLQ